MGCHTQCLMSFVMIVFDMGLNSSKKFKARIVRVQVDVFVFDCFPKALYPGVIGGSFFAIPHNLYSRLGCFHQKKTSS